MTQEQKRKSERAKPAAQPEKQAAQERNEEAQATSDMLDEIDEVLEVNAETFIRDYVQKGGQVFVFLVTLFAAHQFTSLLR